MKNISITASALILVICFSCCVHKEVDFDPRPFMIDYDFIDRPYWWETWPDKEEEIDVNLDIRSEFTGDAYLVVATVGNIYRSCTIYKTINLVTSETTTDSIICSPRIETFKDSLKIDGFHIRAYTQYINDSYFIEGNYYADDALFAEIPVETPFDYPIYFKEIRVRKGKNRENFKIRFPRELASIPGRVDVWIGIGGFSADIKSRFEENFPGDYKLTERDIAYQNSYFESFPDSSKTSFVFSRFGLLQEISFLKVDSQKIYGRYYFFYRCINLNEYKCSPKLSNVEYTYK